MQGRKINQNPGNRRHRMLQKQCRGDRGGVRRKQQGGSASVPGSAPAASRGPPTQPQNDPQRQMVPSLPFSERSFSSRAEWGSARRRKGRFPQRQRLPNRSDKTRRRMTPGRQASHGRKLSSCRHTARPEPEAATNPAVPSRPRLCVGAARMGRPRAAPAGVCALPTAT